jgi:hypothetical protein
MSERPRPYNSKQISSWCELMPTQYAVPPTGQRAASPPKHPSGWEISQAKRRSIGSFPSICTRISPRCFFSLYGLLLDMQMPVLRTAMEQTKENADPLPVGVSKPEVHCFHGKPTNKVP